MADTETNQPPTNTPQPVPDATSVIDEYVRRQEQQRRQQEQQGSVSTFFQNLTDQLTAIPEKVADAVRESNEKYTKPPETETQTGDGDGTEKTTETKPPEAKQQKRKTFAEWWFGT